MFSSRDYWIERYNSGGNSGDGSQGRLAKFKAEVINSFVKENNIKTIIEFGCGDGRQLLLAEYPSYIGFDISYGALLRCIEIFAYDETKTFALHYNGEKAQLTLSLDVIYHLTEDDVYNDYMERLFNASTEFVIIYSSNYEEPQNYHQRRRKFSDWINTKDWTLIKFIPNKYPYDGQSGTSLSDFYIYKRISNE